MNTKFKKSLENKSAFTPSDVSLANAGAILQKALQNLTSEIRSNLILRCDELPLLQISEERLEKAFAELLFLIVTNRSYDRKLFLHISYAQEKEHDNNMHLIDGSNRYQIQFHSNTSPYTDWMPENQQQLNKIAESLVPAGGSIVVNHLNNSGCIFCIALPGK